MASRPALNIKGKTEYTASNTPQEVSATHREALLVSDNQDGLKGTGEQDGYHLVPGLYMVFPRPNALQIQEPLPDIFEGERRQEHERAHQGEDVHFLNKRKQFQVIEMVLKQELRGKKGVKPGDPESQMKLLGVQ